MKPDIIEEIIGRTSISFAKTKGLRWGQSLWNNAQDVIYEKCQSGELDTSVVKGFEELRGSDIDPFYVDARSDAFLQALREI